MTLDEKLNKIIKSISNIESILSGMYISAYTDYNDYGPCVNAEINFDLCKDELSELSKLSAELNEAVKEENKDD